MHCRSTDRLSYLCVALNLSPTDFAALLELPLRRAKRVLKPTCSPSLNLMERVKRAIPHLNPHWLLCGEGEMLLQASTYREPPNSGNSIGVNYGYSIQVINHPSNIDLLQAQLQEKERMIQLLLNQFSLPQFPQPAQ